MDAKKDAKVNFCLSRELDARLRALAAKQKRTRSEVMVEIVEAYVTWCEKKEKQ